MWQDHRAPNKNKWKKPSSRVIWWVLPEKKELVQTHNLIHGGDGRGRDYNPTPKKAKKGETCQKKFAKGKKKDDEKEIHYQE